MPRWMRVPEAMKLPPGLRYATPDKLYRAGQKVGRWLGPIPVKLTAEVIAFHYAEESYPKDPLQSDRVFRQAFARGFRDAQAALKRSTPRYW